MGNSRLGKLCPRGGGSTEVYPDPSVSAVWPCADPGPDRCGAGRSARLEFGSDFRHALSVVCLGVGRSVGAPTDWKLPADTLARDTTTQLKGG